MTTFSTPQPIDVKLEIFAGEVKIIASNRVDTVVEVRAPGKNGDARAAEQTRVDYSNGRLLIKGTKQRTLFGGEKGDPVDVTIELPVGSNVQCSVGMGELRAEGCLGECQIKTASGDVSVDECGALSLETVGGDITVNRAAGQIDITSGSGLVTIHAIDGTAVIKHASGDTHVGNISGELRLNVAKGDVSLGQVSGSAVAKTAKGNIRVNEVVCGSIQIETAYGQLDIGVREGTAAWLDVRTHYGTVRNSLNTAATASPSQETAEVRARTTYGDIAIRRPNPLVP